MKPSAELSSLLRDIGDCRICIDHPKGAPLPHEPRPVLQVSPNAKVAICGQAPGKRVHESGRPFTDPSGDRLREWMDISSDDFYDTDKLAIIPMGFCFPGYNDKGADLPPRKECVRHWRANLMATLPDIEVIILIGGYAQKWHLGDRCEKNVTDTVRNWRRFAPAYYPTPHPSWRNNGWLKRNPWFSAELLPDLRANLHRYL